MKANYQQIDLYQAGFQSKQVQASAAQVFRLSCLLLLVLGGYSALLQYESYGIQTNANNTEQRLQTLKQQFEAQQKVVNETRAHNSPKEELKRIKQVYAQRLRILSSLNAQQEHDSRLFSSYFEGLARRTLDGLWLEKIQINNGGQSIALSGNTYKAELVPQLIKDLKNEPAFKGVTFRKASVSSDNKKASEDQNAQEQQYLSFSLLTHYQDSKVIEK